MAHVDDGQLNALLDGELSPDERRGVEAHLATCAECAGRLNEARAFLTEAGELLSLLTPPVAAASAAPVAPPGIPLVAPVARGPAPAVPPTAADRASGPKIPRTLKEVAVSLDGRTELTPAIRPVQPHEVPPVRRRTWRLPDLEKLAWAASLILAIGVGYLANEVYHQRDEASLLRRTDTAQDAPRNEASPAPVAAAPPTSSAASPSPLATSGATVETTARPADAAQRGAGGRSNFRAGQPPLTRPLSDVAERRDAAAHGPANPAPKPGPASKPPPAGTRHTEELGGINAPARTAREAGAPARSFAQQPAPAPAAAPTTAPRPEAPRAGQSANDAAAADTRSRAAPAGRSAPPANAGAGVGEVSRPNALDEAAPGDGVSGGASAFERISLDQAVRRLSGSIRLIDGMIPARVDVGPGRLVPGANPARDVIRVIYTDERGGRLVLDQQLGGAREGQSVNGLMPGDTLVAITPDGATQIRWIDRKFWLSLTSAASLDSIRPIVERIR